MVIAQVRVHGEGLFDSEIFWYLVEEIGVATGFTTWQACRQEGFRVGH